jgi:hypothetical protein
MKTYSEFIAEAQKRLKSYTVYSGRSPEDAENVRNTGTFREPRGAGASGRGIYGSTNKNVAREYSRRGGHTPEQGDRGVLQMRVPKKHVIQSKPGFAGRSQSYDTFKDNPKTRAVRIPDTATPDELRGPKKSLTGVGKTDKKGDHIVLNPEYASSRIVSRPQPKIKADKPKRRKIAPKKK